MALPSPSESSTAVVTGASSGMGVEMARELAKRGHNVTLVARREDRLRKLAEELGRDHGVRAEVVAADVSSIDGRQGLVDAIRSNGRDVEILINNAGYGSAGRFQELDPETETLMVRTNCEAIVALCAEYVPGMIERGRGAILNVASIAGFQPIPFQVTYSASKAFVRTFTEALTADLHGTGVTATALCPGLVPTEFGATAGIDEGGWDQFPGFIKTSPEENAQAAIEGMEKGKRIVLIGAFNRMSAASGHYTPRTALLGVMRRFYPVGR
jgi:short-subunit dehydrogenase